MTREKLALDLGYHIRKEIDAGRLYPGAPVRVVLSRFPFDLTSKAWPRSSRDTARLSRTRRVSKDFRIRRVNTAHLSRGPLVDSVRSVGATTKPF